MYTYEYARRNEILRDLAEVFVGFVTRELPDLFVVSFIQIQRFVFRKTQIIRM